MGDRSCDCGGKIFVSSNELVIRCLWCEKDYELVIIQGKLDFSVFRKERQFEKGGYVTRPMKATLDLTTKPMLSRS